MAATEGFLPSANKCTQPLTHYNIRRSESIQIDSSIQGSVAKAIPSIMFDTSSTDTSGISDTSPASRCCTCKQKKQFSCKHRVEWAKQQHKWKAFHYQSDEPLWKHWYQILRRTCLRHLGNSESRTRTSIRKLTFNMNWLSWNPFVH